MSFANPADVPRPGGASLDVLRFLAAGFILLFHFGDRTPALLAEGLPVFAQGWLATDFFLLLSGFILSRAYGKRLHDGRVSRLSFVFKRMARLWPPHAVVLLAMLVLSLAATAAGHAPEHREADLFLYQLFFVYGWGVTDVEAWNVPTWSLSVLMVCYALFSLYAARIYGWKRWQWLIALLIVVGAGTVLALDWAGGSLVDLPLRWGLLRGVPLFVAGSLLERLSAGFRLSRGLYAVGIAVTLVLLVVLSGYPRQIWLDTVLLALLGLSIVLSAAVTFRENAVTRRMGRASLSLFLTHSLAGAAGFGLAEVLTQRFGLGTGAQWGLWWGVLMGAVVFAFLFDALIDKPLNAYISRRLP